MHVQQSLLFKHMLYSNSQHDPPKGGIHDLGDSGAVMKGEQVGETLKVL